VSELQSRWKWDLTTSSVATALNFAGFGLETTFYITVGASATTGTVQILSGSTTTGPFGVIASTVAATTGTMVIQEVTGPLLYVKPSVPSSGYIVEAVSFG
jgi:hypothetical protein